MQFFKQFIILFCCSYFTVGVSQNDTLNNVYKKNEVSIEALGKHEQFGGINYGRSFIETETIGLSSSIGFGLSSFHPFDIPIYIHFKRKFNKVEFFAGIGVRLAFGRDRSRGYKTYSDYYFSNYPDVGPPGTQWWYPSYYVDYGTNLGITMPFKKGKFLSFSANLITRHSYFGYTGRYLKLWGGLEFGKRF